jgi:hypothetical protein
MNKIVISLVLLVMGNVCFSQQNLKISGRIPPPQSEKMYRVQLGSFKIPRNAETSAATLRNAGFNPVRESYRDFTRVLLTGISARNIPAILRNVELLGFKEAWITEDRSPASAAGVLLDPDEFHGKNTGPPAGRREVPVYTPPAYTPPPEPSPEPVSEANAEPEPVDEPGAEPEPAGELSTETEPVDEPGAEPEPVGELSAEPEPGFEEEELPLAKNVVIDPTYYEVKIRERRTITLDAFANGRDPVWSSQDPGIVRVDDTGTITGVSLGSTVITADTGETVIAFSVTAVPFEIVHPVPKEQETFVKVDENTLMTPGTAGLAEYKTEPTARLAYRFVNPGDSRGASGVNGGIDILGKGTGDRWMWTTYYQGGFFYDLNGVRHAMTNGVQRDRNGVELRVEPSFVYVDGVPYLQLTHKLTNTSRAAVSGQKFGAGADIMIHNNDHASVINNEYDLIMSDASDEAIASLNLRFIGKAGAVPVSTLWVGRWGKGDYLTHIYDKGKDPHYYEGADSAMTFSFQDITLLPGETREYIVRFTLARNSS